MFSISKYLPTLRNPIYMPGGCHLWTMNVTRNELVPNHRCTLCPHRFYAAVCLGKCHGHTYIIPTWVYYIRRFEYITYSCVSPSHSSYENYKQFLRSMFTFTTSKISAFLIQINCLIWFFFVFARYKRLWDRCVGYNLFVFIQMLTLGGFLIWAIIDFIRFTIDLLKDSEGYELA